MKEINIGTRFVSLANTLDDDENGQARVTPAGSLGKVTSVDDHGKQGLTFGFVFPATGGCGFLLEAELRDVERFRLLDSTEGDVLLLLVDDQQHATILAALRYYQEQGMGEPANRSDAIHEIATRGDELISLDADAIDSLCEEINCSPAITTGSVLAGNQELFSYLDLATGHVSEETMEWLSEATPAKSHCMGLMIAPYEYGAFVSVPGDTKAFEELECADDLKAVLHYARGLNCDVVRFDRDGDTVPGLPHFNW